MSRHLLIQARATADIDRVFTWIGRQSPRGAAAWYAAFLESARCILDAPEHYAVIAEATARWGRAIRQALFKTPRGRLYRLVFEADESEVRVLRVRGPGQPPLQ